MHRSGKGKNVASVLKYHGKMWHNLAVPHFAVPNFARAKSPPPPSRRLNEHIQQWLRNRCCLGVSKAEKNQNCYLTPSLRRSQSREGSRWLVSIVLVGVILAQKDAWHTPSALPFSLRCANCMQDGHIL